MAFVTERKRLIGNALTRAYFEVINAQEAKANDIDKTMLWHIYKAQKCLKQAAALLVEDAAEGTQAEDSSVCDCEQGEANNDVKPCDDNAESQRDNSTDRLLEGLSKEEKAMVLTDAIIKALRGEV